MFPNQTVQIEDDFGVHYFKAHPIWRLDMRKKKEKQYVLVLDEGITMDQWILEMLFKQNKRFGGILDASSRQNGNARSKSIVHS